MTDNKKPLLALIPFLKPFKLEVFFAAIALLITTILVLVLGKVVKYLIDDAFAQNSHQALNNALFMFLFGACLMAVAGYFRSSLVNSLAEKVIANLRRKTYAHIIDVSPQFFEIHKSGDVLSRLTVDSVVLYNAISSNISFFLRNFLLFFGGIILLLITSAKLTLIALSLILLAIAPIVILGKKIKKSSKQAQESIGILSAFIEESINGIKTIQAFLRQNFEIKRFDNFVDVVLQNHLKKIRLKSLTIGLVIALSFSAIALVIFIGGRDVLQGNISSGELSAFLFYAVISATSLVSLSQISTQMQAASAAASRIFEILEIASPVIDKKSDILLENPLQIEFVDVDFAYPSNSEKLVLEKFNLTIKQGEKLAIVGKSGSGKSTILQLLLRFYDVKCGKILINGCKITEISLNNLRQNFAYISQDAFIFSGTIFENIAFAKPDISKAEVEKLISENSALNFINLLPQKLDSFVGEKGTKLSGGERQRIAIARALIKNAEILILDEATSALDLENERIINSWLDDFAKEKTIITIAHRLSSIINAQRIIVMQEGKIAQEGAHQDLIKINGIYKNLYQTN
jgi:ATP-binding cassette subfamily B protein